MSIQYFQAQRQNQRLLREFWSITFSLQVDNVCSHSNALSHPSLSWAVSYHEVSSQKPQLEPQLSVQTYQPVLPLCQYLSAGWPGSKDLRVTILFWTSCMQKATQDEGKDLLPMGCSLQVSSLNMAA
jgi:hypothetical protein